MRKKVFKIYSAFDGLELEILAVMPDEETPVKGAVQFSHGMCENKERYEPLMEYLCERGFACVIHDHRGHGNSVKSPEDLGYIYDGGAESMVRDLYQITKMMKRHWKNVPLIMIAHSMGTLVARSYLKQYDQELDLLILSGAPAKNHALVAGKIIAAAEKLFLGGRHRSKLLETLSFAPFVKKFQKEGSRSAWCCSDPEVVKAYDESSLCGFTFTADAYLALFGLMKRTYSYLGWQCSRPELPILFLSGADDPCMHNVRGFKYELDHLRRQGYWNIRGKLYPGLRHEIFNEKGKEEIYQDIYHYILKNLNVE